MKPSFLFTVLFIFIPLVCMWCKCKKRRRIHTYMFLHVPQHPRKSQRTNLSMGSYLPHTVLLSAAAVHPSPHLVITALGFLTQATTPSIVWLLGFKLMPLMLKCFTYWVISQPYFFHSLQQCRLELINKFFQNYFIICVCRYSQKLKEGNGVPWAGVIGSYKSEC